MIPTLLRRRGFIGPSVCAFCHSDSESLDHLLLDCQFIRDIWHHITNAFLISLDFSAGFHHLVIQAMDLSFSSQVSVLWPTAFMTCVWAIWHFRNRCIFDDRHISRYHILSIIWTAVKEVSVFGIGVMDNSQTDLLRLHAFGIKRVHEWNTTSVLKHWPPPPIGSDFPE